MGNKTETPSSTQRATPSKSGMKAPTVARTTTQQTSRTQTRTEETKKPEPTVRKPTQRFNNLPAGPKSSEKDEVDDIYKEEDPIETSLNKRLKAGAIASTVPDKNSK